MGGKAKHGRDGVEREEEEENTIIIERIVSTVTLSQHTHNTHTYIDRSIENENENNNNNNNTKQKIKPTHKEERMFSKFASLLAFAFVVLLALQAGFASAQDQSADQLFAGKSPDFEKKYCKEHADDKACHDWCKQHPKKDVCQSFIKEKCKKNPEKDFCTHFLKEACPKKPNKDFCKSFCDEHPKKCGTDQKKNQCAYSTQFGATRSTDSSASTSAASKQQVTDSFNSLLAQDSDIHHPGALPISDLKPLLKDLGIDLNKEDFKHVKQKLNNDGYFNLVSFFFWWSEFVLCEAITG